MSRLPHHAELALSNARAELREACTLLRVYMPEDSERASLWAHQIRKLRMAIGIAENVRDMVTTDTRFAELQGKGGVRAS